MKPTRPCRLNACASRLTALVALAFLGCSGVASAASFSVNDQADAPLANPTGTACISTDSGGCTLRAAVQAADNAGGSSTIALPAGDYKLTVENPAKTTSEDEPATGDLDVTEGVTLAIEGAGASSTTIDANHIDRAFAVHSKAGLAISGVTVENGSQNKAEPSDESIAPAYGGAFYNDGSLSIDDSVLSGNSAYSGGGAIYSGDGATSTTIEGSTVTGSNTEYYGGVLDVESGSVTLVDDQITQSSSDDSGGAVYDNEQSGTKGAVTIRGSAIEHSFGAYGGALYLDEAGPLSVSESSLNQSTSYYNGTAIYDEDSGDIQITGSSVSNDSSAYEYGEAIYAYKDGSLTVSSSTFDDDTGTYDDRGGALRSEETNLAVSGSTFEGDTAEDGGAIYVNGTEATAKQSITTSTFANDYAGDDAGGAIDDAGDGDLEVTSSTFDGNSAADAGGALYYESGHGLVLVNDTFDGNQSIVGGALFFDKAASTGSSIELLNDTIARNNAYYGGGIAYPEEANSIENTIVAENSGGYESGRGGSDCYEQAGAADKGGNIDSDGSCFGATKAAGDQTENPLLAPLADNGGPVETDALLPGSPAIGHAIEAACPATDARGVSRSGSSCDVGAYQTVPADLSVAVAAPANSTQSDAIAYTITVLDNGPGPSGGVTLTDSVPDGASLYSVSTSQGSCSGTSTLTCALGALEDGASATVRITAIANATGSLTNTATVRGTATDPNEANNSASATTLVQAFPSSAPASSSMPTTTVRPVTPPSTKPRARTGKASERTGTSVLLSGLINPEGAATTWRLAIGTHKNRLSRLTKKSSAGSGTTPLGVLGLVKGLKPGTRYFAEIVAVNANGTVRGKIISFETTGKAPKKIGKHGKK